MNIKLPKEIKKWINDIVKENPHLFGVGLGLTKEQKKQMDEFIKYIDEQNIKFLTNIYNIQKEISLQPTSDIYILEKIYKKNNRQNLGNLKN